MASATKPTDWLCPDWRARLFGSIVFGIAIVVLFRDFLTECIDRWTAEPQYFHGFAVPLIAIGLGWFRRDKFLHGTACSSVFGLTMIVFGIAGHAAAIYFFADTIEAVSFLLVVSGTALLIWGQRAFSGLWPAVLFLGFMLPLPGQLERALAGPMQVLGANEAAWYIQTCGIPAIVQGNTILMGETRLDVAEACSGLRMLIVFFAVSTAAVIVSRRSGWEKLLMLFSALPIALICNVAGIVFTAAAHNSFGPAAADLVSHDLSGWLMMPLGMLLLFLELKLMDCLFVQAGDSRPGMTYHAATQPVTIQN